MYPRALWPGLHLCPVDRWGLGPWLPAEFPPALDRTPGGVPEGQTPLPGPQGLTDLPPGLSLPDAGDVAHWGSEWAQGQQGQRGYLGTSPLREETGADEEEVGCPGQRHVCRGGTFFPHLEGPGRGPQSRGLQGRG